MINDRVHSVMAAPEMLNIDPPAMTHALVVDDEVVVAMAVAEHCRSLGMIVHEAYGPAEALELLDRVPELEVLITDVRMPVLSGPALAATALARRAGLAVLFITGFATVSEQAGFGRWPVLRKPFDLRDLGPALRRAAALR